MKKILVGLLFISTFNSNAQVTLEHAYPFHNKQFYVTDIGNNDYKYVIVDSSGFSVYNLDHTPYLINFVPPVPIFQAPSYYTIAYLTKSLFDCDSTNLEYAIAAPQGSGNFYIYRTDGTLIFERDTVTGPYCTGCNDGSIWTRPIFNTPDGAKLLLFEPGYQDSIYVYSLCGVLPTAIGEISLDNSYVQIFPNPSSGVINFQINQPNNQDEFKLTIYNSSFQKVVETNIIGKYFQLDIKQKSLAADTYLFELRTGYKVFQTGKFIITK
jgi:hypothetical protein